MWKNSKMGIKDLNSLKEKSQSIKGNFINKFFYLFSKSGFTEEIISLSKIEKNVKLIDLENICE